VSSAIVWFGFGVDRSVSVGEVDFVVAIGRGVTKVWLVSDLVFVEEFDEGLDRLPLGEDAVGANWVACLVPPATFLWTAVVERRFVDGDSAWVLVLPLLVDVVSLDCETCFPGVGIATLEFCDVRHLIASMNVSMRMERMTMM